MSSLRAAAHNQKKLSAWATSWTSSSSSLLCLALVWFACRRMRKLLVCLFGLFFCLFFFCFFWVWTGFWAALHAATTIGRQLSSAACRVFYLNYEMFCQQFVEWFIWLAECRESRVASGGWRTNRRCKLSADRCINCVSKTESCAQLVVVVQNAYENESERRASIKCVSVAVAVASVAPATHSWCIDIHMRPHARRPVHHRTFDFDCVALPYRTLSTLPFVELPQLPQIMSRQWRSEGGGHGHKKNTYFCQRFFEAPVTDTQLRCFLFWFAAHSSVFGQR